MGEWIVTQRKGEIEIKEKKEKAKDIEIILSNKFLKRFAVLVSLGFIIAVGITPLVKNKMNYLLYIALPAGILLGALTGESPLKD